MITYLRVRQFSTTFTDQIMSSPPLTLLPHLEFKKRLRTPKIIWTVKNLYIKETYMKHDTNVCFQEIVSLAAINSDNNFVATSVKKETKDVKEKLVSPRPRPTSLPGNLDV